MSCTNGRVQDPVISLDIPEGNFRVRRALLFRSVMHMPYRLNFIEIYNELLLLIVILILILILVLILSPNGIDG